MATIKQRKALEKMVENGGIASAAMIDVGYSPATAQTPQKLTTSLGFKELCDQLGLTESFLTKALVNDIKKKPRKRKAELELGFKVIGRLKEREEPPSLVTNNFIQIVVNEPNTGNKPDPEAIPCVASITKP